MNAMPYWSKLVSLRTMLLFVMAMTLSSCKPKPAVLTSEDQAVFMAVIKHFIDSKNTESPPDASIVLMADKTPEKSGMLDEGQLVYELSSYKHELPKDTLKNLRTRNTCSVSLESFTPKLSNVSMAKQLPDTHWPFRKVHPEIKACIHAWLPGYSADRHSAAVRFWYGPLTTSNHSATGTYKLIKRNAEWQVEWAVFIEYP